MRLSVGRTGSCHDNALAESLFATLKNEWYYHKRLLDASTTKHKAHEFIESYYNRFRPHKSIGDRVPAEVMQEFFERLERPCVRSKGDADRIESEIPLSIILTGLNRRHRTAGGCSISCRRCQERMQLGEGDIFARRRHSSRKGFNPIFRITRACTISIKFF
ncbi:integrase core domain-containing protein [Atopobium sp. oral taxon 416]|uniref:integrase core domain-containing protein n=1 Tax=Atopobium sp. oral taxon 416 TaxID=712157 RepID=UPI001BACED4E|nr:integrase core domain-containing protein [Atopobium sp. oral taxon 416]QUC02804.1 integrase core domain-containing protein [Atopobium sp. oral taxon 416]